MIRPMNLDFRLLQRGFFALLVMSTVTFRNGIAVAQEPTAPSTVVFETEATSESLESLARALTRVVSARADTLGVIRLSGTPALGLEDLQLALGCIGETTECLTSVADQLEVDALLVPSVERSGETFIVSVLHFDKRQQRARRAARRSPVSSGDDAVLGGVEPILRELFGLPEATDDGSLDLHVDTGASTSSGATSGHTTASGGQHASEPDFPLVPIVVAGAGVVLVAAGVVFGVLSMDSQSNFASATLDSEASVDAAIDAHDRASWQAVTADVFLAAGAVAIVTGAVLFLVDELGGDEEPTVAVSPYVGPNGFGVGLSGSVPTW